MFIDIHCHILPGLDDGVSTFEESLKMLEIAKNDGISGIVATPHVITGVYHNTPKTIIEALLRIREKADNLALYPGAEIRIDRDLVQRLLKKELLLINNKNYMLLEMPAYSIPPIKELSYIVSSLKMKRITPIIAHPERNMVIIQNPGIMERLIEYGAISQVTAMSITKNNGAQVQKVTLKMIEKGYIHVVASDAHDAKKRPPILSEAYRVVLKTFGEDEAKRLFVDNPLKIINGQEIDCQLSVQVKKKKSFINFFRKLFSYIE